MKDNIQIIPAILATNEEEYRQKMEKIAESGAFEGGWVQIDLMDNRFVQNQSVDPDVIARYKNSFQLEAHLMVDYPEGWIDELVKVGVKRIIFPLEDIEGINERIQHIKNHGIEVGLALNPETPVAKIAPFIATMDMVLVLSVHPGFGGQEFIPESIDKVKELGKLKKEGNKFLIEVDGGINEVVSRDLVAAGADNLVIGSYLLDGDITENLEKIWENLTF